MMLQGLRRSIGLQVARFRLRGMHDEMMSFSASLSSAERLLLIMPMRSLRVLSVVNLIGMLSERFTGDHITVVTAEHSIELMNLLPHTRFVRVAPSDLTVFCLPRRDVFQGIKGTYDLAIDLNLDFVLPSGYICKASKARVRLGFASRHADLFYNFQVRQELQGDTDTVYDRLASCLRMF